MRVRYVIPFTRKVIIPDHWEIPFQGGVCRIVEEGGRAKAMEVVFAQQPLEQAPRFVESDGETAELTLVNGDQHLSFVTHVLGDAMAFLQSYFEIDLAWHDIEARYEGETPEEEALIEVKSFSIGRHVPSLVLPFDLLARSIMCAHKARGPRFESALVSAATKAISEQQYINSFRYSFLLIESIYGAGQFKSSALKSVFKADAELRSVVDFVLKSEGSIARKFASDTAELLEKKPTVDALIDHLVDKRGFYFHGNVRRQDAWRAEKQDEAHALAFVALLIAQGITQKAAAPMFTESSMSELFDNAKKVGAILVYQIDYSFREPEEEFSRNHRLSVKMPGSKPTPLAALQVAKEFIRHFEEKCPLSDLEKAICTVDGGKKVFEINFAAKD